MNAPIIGPVLRPGTVAGISVTPNTFASAANDSGDTVLEAASANHIVVLALDGVARTSIIALDETDRSDGDRMRVCCLLPEVAGIELEFRGGSTEGVPLLPNQTFPDQLFISDGVVTSADFSFVYTPSGWLYAEARIPA